MTRYRKEILYVARGWAPTLGGVRLPLLFVKRDAALLYAEDVVTILWQAKEIPSRSVVAVDVEFVTHELRIPTVDVATLLSFPRRKK